MAFYAQKKTFVSQLFKQRQLRPFEATQQELQIAKQSLIYKKKCSSNVHSILFCKSFDSSSTQFTTQNQKKILQEQKSKYFDYIRKTFKQKIPQDFQSQNKLKKALKNKLRQQRQNQREANGEQILKRPRQITQNPKVKDKKQKKQQPKNKKVPEEKDEKKIVADQQNYDDIDDVLNENFDSEVDLHNDEIDQSYGNDDNEI